MLFLIYLFLKNRSGGSSDSTGDTSNLPTVISTGGGVLSPMVPSFGGAQTFDTNLGTSQPASAPAVSGPSYTVMPGTSASGVPAHTDQAQEFNTGNPVAAPGSSTPSFYNTNPTAPLPYVDNSNPTLVNSPRPGLSANPDLMSFLTGDLHQYEISADLNIGNKQAYTNDEQIRQNLIGESSSYCSIHPEACASGDQSSIINGLIQAYDSFTQSATTKYSQQQTDSQVSQYKNPSGVTPVGQAVMTKDPTTGMAVWLTPNQIDAQHSTTDIAKAGATQTGPTPDPLVSGDYSQHGRSLTSYHV